MMLIVAQDGSGDYRSIQEAVDAARSGEHAPTIILIREGVYRERVVIHRDNLRLIGEDREKTVITHSACAKDLYPDGREKGTFLSFSVLVTGRNVTLENLTIRNDAGDGTVVGQAVALYAAGDRGSFRRCSLIACQDTLFTGPVMPEVLAEAAPYEGGAECVPAANEPAETHARLYFEDCLIRGDVDFIFGSYRCWFEGCTLYMNARGGWYTAANTPRSQPYGYVFHRCRLTGECPAGKAYLGRPWRAFARTLFLECEMDECVAPEGFADWDAQRVVTERCGEYASLGPGGSQVRRHPSQKRLTELEALRVNVPEVLGGFDGWRPDRRIPTWYLCGDSTMADYPPERAPMAGWGQMLPPLVPDACIENRAVCGRSSKSFIDEGRLRAVEACLCPGDRVLISFSHNDEKSADPSRYTAPETTYPAYLTAYIDAAWRHGAEPVLITPVARRRFTEDGRLTATHGAYPDAMRRLARQTGCRLIDLERATMRAFQQAGPDGTKHIFCHLPRGTEHYPEGLEDNTHFQEEGATLIAKLFLERLRDPELRDEDFAAVEAGDCDELIAREDDVLKTN